MKKKQARCMADGGVILETPEQMLARMNAKYGLGDAGKSPAPQPQPAPTKQPAASPQPSQPSGLMGKATDAIGRRNEELKKAANYARGGVMPVVGAGTGTSDSVPVVVAGQDVRLSNGEGAAILPARTMRNPAAVQAVEGIIEATNGKPPVKGARGLAYGGVIDPEEEKRRKAQAPTAQEVYGPAYRGIAGALSGGTATTPTSAPTAQEVYRGVSAQGIADAVTPRNNLASHPIYSGVSAQGMIDAVTPGSGQAPAPVAQTAPQTPVVSPVANALRRPTAISAPAQQVQAAPPEVRSLWAGMDTRRLSPRPAR